MFDYSPPPPPPPQKVKKSNEVSYSKNPTKLFKRVEGKAWESATDRISTHQVESRIWVVKTAFDGSLTWKRLPLHEACIRKPTPTLIHSLLQSYPRAALKPDSDGRLPLHHACANNASLEVVEKLLMLYPESMEVQDTWRKTPIQTLMSTYFPDPHVISALKKDVNHYKTKAVEEAQNAKGKSDFISPIRATASTETAEWTPLSLKSTSGETISSLPKSRSPTKSRLPIESSRYLSQSSSQFSSQPIRTESRALQVESAMASPVDRSRRRSMGKDTTTTMTSAMENEIGKFSKKLASSMNKENSMQKKIQSLETEVNRLLVIENENNRMRNDLVTLENELRSSKGSIEREREENRRDIQMIEELRRSEDQLKRQIEDMNHDPRPRMLEDKISSLVEALEDRDERHKMEIQNLQRAFQSVEDEAVASRKDASHLEDENNRLSLELKRLEYQLNARMESEEQMIAKLNESKHAEMEAEMLERRYKDQEKKFNDMNQKVRMLEEENSELRHERTEFSRLQMKYRSQEDFVNELDGKLRRANDEAKRMSDQISGKERDVEQQKMSMSAEKKKLERRVEELLDDLKRAEKKNIDASRDKADLESKLKILRMSLRQATQERDDLEKQEDAINTELNKIQRTLDVKIAEYKQKFLDEQAKAVSSAEKCKNLEAELRKLRTSLDETNVSSTEAMRESLKQREDIKDKMVELEKLEREKRDLEEKLTHVEGGKEKYKRKAIDAQNKLKESNQTRISLDTETRLIAAEREKFQREKAELVAKVSSLSEELHEARSQMSVSVLKESDFLSKINQSRAEIVKLKNCIDHVERERTGVAANVNEVTKQNELLARERRDIEAEKSELAGRMALLQLEVQKMESRIEALNNERDQGAKKLCEQQDETKRQKEALEGIIVDLEKQISSMRKMNSERDIEIRKLLEEQSGSRRQKEALQGQKFDLEKQLKFMRRIRERSNSMGSDRDVEMKKLMDQLDESNRVKLTLEEKVADLESQISFMTMEAEWDHDEKEDGSKGTIMLRHFERQIKKQAATIQELEDEREAMQKKLDQTSEESDVMRRMLDQADDLSELAELTERLERVEEEKDSEISRLMEEREELLQEVTSLEEKVLSLENDIKRLSTNSIIATSDISKLKALRDRKKKNIYRRLEAYENRISSASSVVSSMSAERRAHALRQSEEDTMSVVSGVTMGSRIPRSEKILDSDKLRKWKTKYRSPLYNSQNEGDGPEEELLSPLSDYEESSSSKKEKKKVLQHMFPSSISVTGLSFDASMSSVRRKDGVPRDVTVSDLPSVIMEDRNGSESGSRC